MCRKSCCIGWPTFQHCCTSSGWREQTFRRPETLCKTNMEMSLAATNGIWISSQSLQRWKSWHVFPYESGSQGSCKYTFFSATTTDTFTHLLGRHYGGYRQILGDIHWPPKSMKSQKENHSWVKNLDISLWKHPMSLAVILSLRVPESTFGNRSMSRDPRETNTHAWEFLSSRGHHNWSWLLFNSCSFERNQWPNKWNKDEANKCSGSCSVVTSVKAGICHITCKLEQIGQEASSWLGFSSTETQA